MRSRALLALAVSILVAGISYEVQAVTVGEITGPTDPVEVNTTVNFSAEVTDTDPNTHTWVWNWGDGTTSDSGGGGGDDIFFGAAVPEGNVCVFLSESHEYSTPGVYTVKLTVTEQDWTSAVSEFQYVIVYSAEGGFVTGGGWIESPLGAYAADPSQGGKANFGFVAKYKKGATVPTGETQFCFHAGALDFHSTEYQWLVIAGAKAKYKGSGTIKGSSGDYGFMLSAVDGQLNGGGGVDKFRIKIWDKATDTIVYDNQMGDTDDGDATTELEGGSIVIHVPKVKEEPEPEEPSIPT